MAQVGQSHGKIDSSSIVDMDVVESDISDYETNFGEHRGEASFDDNAHQRHQHQTGQEKEEPFLDEMKKQAGQNVASYVFQTGAQTAKKAFSVYANIDILRPYFDVEPHQVRTRLLHSLMPVRSLSDGQQVKVPRELYGPTMLVFTLIAALLYQMKTSGHTVQEGTLMGSAFAVCFGYWLGVSSLVWFLSYVCNTRITMAQILSLLGYALFGHCAVLIMTTIIHTSHDHLFFYVMWGILGGLSTLKMISVLTSRTAGRTQKLILCGVVAFLHLTFLLYLHFAYHQIVEDISAVIDQPAVPNFAGNEQKITDLPKDNRPDVALTKAPLVAREFSQAVLTNQPPVAMVTNPAQIIKVASEVPPVAVPVEPGLVQGAEARNQSPMFLQKLLPSNHSLHEMHEAYKREAPNENWRGGPAIMGKPLKPGGGPAELTAYAQEVVGDQGNDDVN